MGRAVPSAPMPIPTKIGPRSQTWPKDGGSRTALPRETIVRLSCRVTLQKNVADSCKGKKLKARLEDLERKAGSGSVSPQPESRRSSSEASHEERSREMVLTVDSVGRARYGRQISPDMMAPLDCSGSSGDERFDMYDRQYNKPPQLFAYSSMASSDQSLYASYPQHTPLQSMPIGMGGDYSNYSSYPLSSHTALGGLSTSSSHPGLYADEDLLNPFSISYSSMGSADVALPQFQEYSTNVNDLDYYYSRPQ
jgi:hypothetical protein